MKLVTLTFDDGLDNHLDTVMPLLEQHGFRGTFFVNPCNPTFTRRLDAWRMAAKRGHELGNHTLFHPSWRHKGYVTEGNDVETYSVDRMRLELEAVNHLLAGLDGEQHRTFAYPCCTTVVGRPGWTKRLLQSLHLDRTRLMGALCRYPRLDFGSCERSYVPLASSLFSASRTGGEAFSASPGHYPPSKAEVPCIMLDGKNKLQLQTVLQAFERVETGWLVFAAHGIGTGLRLNCDADVFEYLLAELKATSWSVVTFRDGAQAILGTET